MKNQTQMPEDARLSTLLRESLPSPDLPPGFQNAVWRRIESAQAPATALSLAGWLDRVAAWLLQPRLALAGAVTMLLVGISIGVLQAGSLADDLARQQYLAAVSPSVTH